MKIGFYNRHFRPLKALHDIIAEPLSKIHSSISRCFIMVTISYRPLQISPMRAWSEAQKDLLLIIEAIKKHPQYSYAISAIEPHSGETDSYCNPILYSNDSNPTVELERFFIDSIFTENTSASELLLKIANKIKDTHQQYGLDKSLFDMYRELHNSFPGYGIPSVLGYPQFHIAVSMKNDPVVITRFPTLKSLETMLADLLPSYLEIGGSRKGGHFSSAFSRESNLTTRAINDTNILIYLLRNASKLPHRYLLNTFPISVFDPEVELVSLLQAVNSKMQFKIALPSEMIQDIPQKRERFIIGNGIAPPAFLPIHPTAETKIHICADIVTDYMRQNKIYIEATTEMIYQLKA